MTEPIEQIPWAQAVRVTYFSDFSIALQGIEKVSVDVYKKNFEWNVSIDSKISIKNYMTEDEKLTRDIQEDWEEHAGSFHEKIKAWLKREGEARPRREGPKGWRPKRRIGRIGRIIEDEGYSYGNTYNEDNAYWWGDVFEYAAIELEEGERGAVIVWHAGGDPRGNYELPRVYLGRFSEFMDAQREGDPWDPDTFLHWNGRIFENGLMWAWEKLGVFDDPDLIGEWSDRHVHQVAGAVKRDPTILLPESIEKIMARVDEFPPEFGRAVDWLMANKRKEIEKAIGQKLIWGDLYE